MKVLFVDTETTSLPDNRLAADHPGQPWLVQIAALLRDGDRELCRLSAVVKSPVESHPKALAAHGYTKEMTDRWGIDPGPLLGALQAMVAQADMIVAHNLKFDSNVLRIAYMRWLEYVPMWLTSACETPACLCTMDACRPYCKLPATPAMQATGRGDQFKPPRLEEALKILCGEELVGAHDAMNDVLGCARLYDWLEANGHLEAAA